MKKTYKTIVFFGSGPVAAATLQCLLKHFEVELVFTKARPAHHKTPAPVETLAREHHLTVCFADSKKGLDTLLEEISIKSLVGVLVDYGVILSEKSLQSFKLGVINSHFSLLPEWRGADPITFAILSGQDKTGVSLMKAAVTMDTGPLLSQEILHIGPKMTGPELTRELVTLSNKMLLRDLPLYLSGQITPYEQPATETTYSRKLTKQDGAMDWLKPAKQLEREIRAFYEWPKSRAKLGDYDVIIREATVLDQSGEPGSYQIQKNRLVIYTGKSALDILKVQPAGKKEMLIPAFLAGYKI